MAKRVGQGGPEYKMLFQSLIPLNDEIQILIFLKKKK